MIDVSDDLPTFERRLFSAVPTREQLDRLLLEHTQWVTALYQTRDALSELVAERGLNPGQFTPLNYLNNAAALVPEMSIPVTNAYTDLVLARTLWKPSKDDNAVGWSALEPPPDLPSDPSPARVQAQLTQLHQSAPLPKVGLGQMRQILAAHVLHPPTGLTAEQRQALRHIDNVTLQLLELGQSSDRQAQQVQQADKAFPPAGFFAPAEEPDSGQVFRPERFSGRDQEGPRAQPRGFRL